MPIRQSNWHIAYPFVSLLWLLSVDFSPNRNASVNVFVCSCYFQIKSLILRQMNSVQLTVHEFSAIHRYHHTMNTEHPNCLVYIGSRDCRIDAIEWNATFSTQGIVLFFTSLHSGQPIDVFLFFVRFKFWIKERIQYVWMKATFNEVNTLYL